MTEQQPPFFSQQGEGQTSGPWGNQAGSPQALQQQSASFSNGSPSFGPAPQQQGWQVPGPAPQPQKGYLGKLLGFAAGALVLGAVMGLLVSYFYSNNQLLTENAATIKRLAKAQRGAEANKTSLVKEEDNKADYLWNFKNLAELTFTNDNQKGLTADQLVDTFGLASQADLTADELELHWGSAASSSNQNLVFSFRRIDDNYYLDYVKIQSPLSDYVDDAADLEEGRSNMSTEYFKGLKSGNSKTGQGGTDLLEVLKEYPQPSNFVIGTEPAYNYRYEGRGTYKSDRVVATLSYNVGDDYEYLTFIRQKDGSFAYVESKKPY